MKVVHVAVREIVATVATKGFVIGVLVTPVLLAVMLFVFPVLLDEDPPKVDGSLRIIDPTGAVAPEVAAYLSPAAMLGRRQAMVQRLEAEVPAEVAGLVAGAGRPEAMSGAVQSILGELPTIALVELPAEAEAEVEKIALLAGEGLLGVAAIDPGAVTAKGSYELYVREKLDDRIQRELEGALRHGIVTARLRARALDPEAIVELTEIEGSRVAAVTEGGEFESSEALNLLLPAGFMILMLVSVLTGGQYLMSSTIEEKSSRVVEVLLAAVSPLELMTGKIVGQMAVGFIVLAIYSAMGVSALLTFSLLGLLDPWLFLYLALFYLTAYFVIASLMAAVGAAVNDIREAQTLMSPIMIAIMIPWLLWLPISRDPDSLFSVTASLLPPINSFVMILRLTSTSPPPHWQVWLSLGIGALSVWGALWFAAKVFRIGLLMHGTPPSFRTLWRWIRMA